jgi:hypothetical protein
MLATLKAVARAAEGCSAEPLEVPGLGTFRARRPRPDGMRRKEADLLFTPCLPPPPPQPAPPPPVSLEAWRAALRETEKPLVDPLGRFVVLFSAKSACSTVVIWFLHVLGLDQEARAYSEWPHNFRTQKFYKQPDYLAARTSILPDQVKVLRVVRDPFERAGSSFRHALGTTYALADIRAKLGIDVPTAGLSFERFIDFLELEDLKECNPHHSLQKHVLEDVRPPDFVINASRQDLFEGLNAFERAIGLPETDFPALAWAHELQASRVPHSVLFEGDAYRTMLTVSQAQKGPWPKGLISAEARVRLEKLYAEDISLYCPAQP